MTFFLLAGWLASPTNDIKNMTFIHWFWLSLVDTFLQRENERHMYVHVFFKSKSIRFVVILSGYISSLEPKCVRFHQCQWHIMLLRLREMAASLLYVSSKWTLISVTSYLNQNPLCNESICQNWGAQDTCSVQYFKCVYLLFCMTLCIWSDGK